MLIPELPLRRSLGTAIPAMPDEDQELCLRRCPGKHLAVRHAPDGGGEALGRNLMEPIRNLENRAGPAVVPIAAGSRPSPQSKIGAIQFDSGRATLGLEMCRPGHHA